jgi:hypothetical protein
VLDVVVSVLRHTGPIAVARSRRSTVRALSAVLVMLLAMPAVTGAAPTDPIALLDRPRVDVAELSGAGPGGGSRVLVVDPLGSEAAGVHLTVLHRGPTWSVAAEMTVDIGRSVEGAVGQPWIVGLGDERFALIVSSESGDGSLIATIGVGSAARGSTVTELDRRWLDDPVDDAGVADVTGDGRPDLVVATARTVRTGGTCQGSTITVFRDGDLRFLRRLEVPETRLAAGVIGSFDDVPGDDLAVYAYPNCPAGPDRPTTVRLMAVRLADGTTIVDRPAAGADALPQLGPPIRFDVDGDTHHELLGHVPRGLAIIDPTRAWSDIRIATGAAFPLLAAPVTGADGTPRMRVSWMEPSIEGRGSIGVEMVERAPDGSLDSGPATVMWDSDPPTVRWRLAVRAAQAGAADQAGPAGWVGNLGDDPGCPDALVPTAVLDCATGALLAGPAWVGTQPLLPLDAPEGRRLLVAVGLARSRGPGVAVTPTPWAGSPAGRWRHGPSAPFSLAEVTTADATSPGAVARPSVDPYAALGPALVLSAPTGTRLLVDMSAIDPDAADPSSPPGSTLALDPSALTPGSSVIVRISGPPGEPPGDGRASIQVPLPDDGRGGAAERWAVTAIPFDDRGETGLPLGTTVGLDREGPAVSAVAPAISPPWPFTTSIGGTVEPGAQVVVDGVGPAEVDPQGSFTFETALAPWPQTLRIVATDPQGNMTVLPLTAVGGVDYRDYPWPAIVAVTVISAAIVSGALGSRRRRDPSGAAARHGAGDDGGGPVMEDLGPDDGLGPRS